MPPIENVPATHGTHDDPTRPVPAAHDVGGGGGGAVHEVDPIGAVVPAAHAVQLVLAAIDENVSAGQSVGKGAPIVETYDPAGAGWHVAPVPPAEYVPGGHGLHDPPDRPCPGKHDVGGAVQLVEPAGDVVPAGQALHDTLPTVAVNEFAGHNVGAAAPAVANDPAGAG